MGSSQQIIAGLALLAVAVSVAGRPVTENAPLPPSDLPKDPVKLTEDAPKLPATEEKKPEKQTILTEDTALVASLPGKLPGKASDVPVVIADLPVPEAVVVVQDAQAGRFLARMARTHLPVEARDAGSEEYIAFPLSASVNDPDSLERAKQMMSRALPGRQEDEIVAKKLRRQRVLFRDDPIIDARSAGESRKILAPDLGIQHSPVSHNYEVREPGRETIVHPRPATPVQADPEEKSKLQLIRHIHHQHYAIPFVNPGQLQQKSQQGISLYPPVFNSKPAGDIEKPITGYFPFVINNPAMSYNAGLAQSITDVFEYGQVAPAQCAEKHRTARRARAVGFLPEEFKVGTTVETPIETTLMPESRDVGNLAGPVVQSITREDDEDKIETTIVLGGDDADEGDDDEDEQAESALDDEDEEDESSPNVPSKGGLQKKLKDKLNEIEKKVRKRVKNSQQNLNGIRKQVNKHVTEIVMHSEGGLEEAGPIVSKLVVRRGGVAIAGPGGIATAGFGGTAIVGPGGTAYTSPDSLAVAGPGARVISVPSAKLQEMFDSFRKQNGRNIEAFKPSWLGTIPTDGKLVATGPVVFFNPPEQVVPGFNLS